MTLLRSPILIPLFSYENQKTMFDLLEIEQRWYKVGGICVSPHVQIDIRIDYAFLCTSRRLVPSITSVYTKDYVKEAIPDLWINYSLNNHIVLIELQKNILFDLYKSPLA